MINPEKYQNKYRIKSTRKENYDYSQVGAYFITICTKDRLNHFGGIVNSQMDLNDIGQIVFKCWQEIPQHFPHVMLDEFVVMPNHIHGIVMIVDVIKNGNEMIHSMCRDEALPRLYVGNDGDMYNCKLFMSRISPKPGSISVIVGSYKSICTKMINKKYPNINFKWQPRFYDKIIRNQDEFLRIQKYIYENPIKRE